MIGGLLLAARYAVDLASDQPVGGLRGEQKVVDAQTFVTRPAATLIIPKTVLAYLIVEGPPGFG